MLSGDLELNSILKPTPFLTQQARLLGARGRNLLQMLLRAQGYAIGQNAGTWLALHTSHLSFWWRYSEDSKPAGVQFGVDHCSEP